MSAPAGPTLTQRVGPASWPIRVVKGTGEQVRGKLLRSAVAQAALAVLFAAVAGGILRGFLGIAPGIR